jgi:hypothetical protein
LDYTSPYRSLAGIKLASTIAEMDRYPTIQRPASQPENNFVTQRSTAV